MQHILGLISGASLRPNYGLVYINPATLLIRQCEVEEGGDWDHPTSEQIQTFVKILLNSLLVVVEFHQGGCFSLIVPG